MQQFINQVLGRLSNSFGLWSFDKLTATGLALEILLAVTVLDRFLGATALASRLQNHGAYHS